ncbi:MAG: ammonium transporter, partial [Alphaproteobacteria bacterium]|nr:ammonium transporter [Alphaproteobacteria bacterium]
MTNTLRFLSLLILSAALLIPGMAEAQEAAAEAVEAAAETAAAIPVEIGINAELAYILNSFLFLICGALVMWMAAGFSMLEAGLVRAKNTSAICLKNL